MFVLVAIYVTGSPAAQALSFVQFSLFQCLILMSHFPYDSWMFNTLETFNELTVLTIGYHVLVLCFDDILASSKERLGLSMMTVVIGMIGINGLNWLI